MKDYTLLTYELYKYFTKWDNGNPIDYENMENTLLLYDYLKDEEYKEIVTLVLDHYRNYLDTTETIEILTALIEEWKDGKENDKLRTSKNDYWYGVIWWMPKPART